jgi:hypothetical protein
MLSDLLLRLIVWLWWLFLRPFYSGKETKAGGVSGIFAVFFCIYSAVRVSGKFCCGICYVVRCHGRFGFLPSASLWMLLWACYGRSFLPWVLLYLLGVYTMRVCSLGWVPPRLLLGINISQWAILRGFLYCVLDVLQFEDCKLLLDERPPFHGLKSPLSLKRIIQALASRTFY